MNNMLARPGLDWGIPTDHGAAMREFYEKVIGLPFLDENEIIPGTTRSSTRCAGRG